MFSRSRKKIILSIMLSLILLFAVTLSVIMLASYHEIRQQSSEMLERYVELYSLDQQPGTMKTLLHNGSCTLIEMCGSFFVRKSFFKKSCGFNVAYDALSEAIVE